MANMGPAIIEVAINGATSKARNPHVPHSPEEIAEVAIACIDAGAGLVHNHIEDITTSGAAAAERYAAGWDAVMRAHPDAVMFPTVVFNEDRDTRYAHLAILADAGKVSMAAFDPGSVNLAIGMKDGLPDREIAYVNGYDEIRHAFDLFSTLGIAASMAIYDPSFVRAVLAWDKAGKLPAGSFTKFYFGGDRDFVTGDRGAVSFGLPPTLKALEAYLEMYEPTGRPWGVAVMGGDVVETGMARLALERGGHVRVGLEDYSGDGQPSNVELVEAVVALCREVGRPVATPAEAREILGMRSMVPA